MAAGPPGLAARELFQRDIIQPSQAAPGGLPRLRAMCTALTAYVCWRLGRFSRGASLGHAADGVW
jgi:hypothetical protein